MTRQMRLLASASLLAVAALGASPAFAAGTVAGTTVSNTASISYSVGGVAQTAVPSNQDQFLVDRKVIMTLVDTDGATTTVAPGQVGGMLTYTLTNASNDTLDFGLAAVQLSGGAGAHSNTDTFDVSNLKIFVDVNNNGTYESGTDTLTYVDELAPDTSRKVFVFGDIAAAQTSGVSAITLSATARAGGTAATQGAVLTNDSGTANVNGTVQTVFAEAASGTDAQYNGVITALDDYTVASAQLTVTKTSKIISDPISSSNPKMIPGAVVEYCIAVSNAAGGATATNISISDTIPVASVTYNSGFGVLQNATVSGGVCSGGAAGGTYNAGTNVVSGTLADIAGGSASAIRFQVTVK